MPELIRKAHMRQYERVLQKSIISGLLKKWFARNSGLLYGKTARQGTASLADQGIVSLTNFSTGVIIARTCSCEELGLYSLGFSIILFLSGLQSALISLPYTVFSPRIKADERAAYTGSTLIHQLLFSVLSVALIVVMKSLLTSIAASEGMSSVISILTVAIPFVLLREYGRQLFISRLNINSALVVDIVIFIIQISGLIIFAKLGILSAEYAYYIITAACLSASIVIIFMICQHSLFQVKQAVSHFKMNWSIGKWASVSGLASLAGIQLYPWLITKFRSLEETGVLAACLGIVFMINPVILGLGNFLAARITHTFAEQGVKPAHDFLNKCCILFCGIMATFSVAMFFVGGDLLRLIYGSQYAGFDMIVRILVLAFSVEIVSLPYNCGLHMLGKSKLVFIGSLINVFITLTIGLWLLNLFGPPGVALGLLTGYSLSAVFRWKVYHSSFNIFLAV